MALGRRWFTIEGVYTLHGRVIAVPGVSGDFGVVPGTPIELHRPDGAIVAAVLGGVEFLSPNRTARFPVWLLGVSPDDIPIGTEVVGP